MQASHEVLLTPIGCLLEPSHEGEALAFHASEALAAACPDAIALLREFAGEPGKRLAALHPAKRRSSTHPQRARERRYLRHELLTRDTSVALALAGLLVTAINRRWRLLAVIGLSVALIFVPLGRNLTHDGLTGARYFVLLPALLALVASLALAPIERWLHPLAPRQRRAALLAGALALVGVESWSAREAWRHEYTFQAEYRALAATLTEHERELEGCTVWYVHPRQSEIERDLDCCLWPERSPLELLVPTCGSRHSPLNASPTTRPAAISTTLARSARSPRCSNAGPRAPR